MRGPLPPARGSLRPRNCHLLRSRNRLSAPRSKPEPLFQQTHRISACKLKRSPAKSSVPKRVLQSIAPPRSRPRVRRRARGPQENRWSGVWQRPRWPPWRPRPTRRTPLRWVTSPPSRKSVRLISRLLMAEIYLWNGALKRPCRRARLPETAPRIALQITLLKETASRAFIIDPNKFPIPRLLLSTASHRRRPLNPLGFGYLERAGSGLDLSSAMSWR